jgi:hypothetical protein
MGVNQVSLSFYPLRWQEQLATHPKSVTDQGTLVQFAVAVRVEGADQPRVPCNDFREWLTQEGFAAVDWGRGSVYYRGEVCSTFGVEKEIDVGFSDEAGELTSVGCRFTLSREAPVALPSWIAFAAGMCQKFCLRLAMSGTTTCSEEELRVAIRRHRFWREFAKSFGWGA